jgi:hypothetical protein
MRALALVVALVVGGSAVNVAVAGPSQADLVKTRIDTASKAYDHALARWKAATITVDAVAAWSVRWLTAVRETPAKGKALKTALAEHLARMQDLLTQTDDAVNKGTASPLDRETVSYFVTEAELWVARGK